jgi:gamma-glutamyltranspeptidase/glutathione hydrolase
VPADSGGFSGLVAVDSKAGAAACTLSMGQLFGARVIVPGTGVLLGAATPDAGSVSPMIIASANNGEFTFAGAGGGAPTAAQATGAVARATVEEEKSLVAVLNARGGQGGTVNAIVCPSGLRSSAATCRSAIDPAGAGLALLAIVR